MEILRDNEEPLTDDVPQPEAEDASPVHQGFSGVRPSVLKVSARSRPTSVAGALAAVVREVGRAELQAIGAGATNQAVKAVTVARSYLQEDGIEIVCVPSFAEVVIEKEKRTAIRLVVEKR